MATANTEQIISIKDERLDIDLIDQYRLSFFISARACQITVFDVKKKKLLLFEHREFDSSLSVTANLEMIHKDHILIAAGFWKEIQVFVRNDKFSLIPNPVFDKSLLYEYVRLNAETDPERHAYHFKMLDDFNLSIAFGYSANIKKWFQNKYPNVSTFFSHQAVAYLKGINNQLKEKASASLYLNLNHHEALIAGFNLQKVAIYNQFGFKDAKHLVKIVLLTIQQFSQEGQSTPILLTGVKEKVDLYLPVFKKYFKHIELGKRPDNVVMHPIFNELEPYEYFEVFSNL